MISQYALKQHGKQTDPGSIALDKSCQYSGPDHCGIFSSLNFCKRLFGYPFT